MIEHSHRPLLPPSGDDVDSLQKRAAAQRTQRHGITALHSKVQQARTTLDAPARSFTKLPTRYILHAVVALAFPVAVALSNLPAGVAVPERVAAPVAANADFVAPVAPLSLDTTSTIGDEPLPDDAEIPVPLSLTSRLEALAPVVVGGSIAGERIYLRNGPGTDYDAVGRMSAGTPVQVIGRYGDWYQVRESVDKPVFWVSGELLNIAESDIYSLFEVEQAEIPALPPRKLGIVSDTGLQLRDGPGTNYVPMTKLEAGAQVEIFERYQDWFHVGVNGTDGWVKSEFIGVDQGIVSRVIEAETIPSANPAMVGVITESGVNLRLGPDSKYGKVGNVGNGTEVALIGKYGDWFKVKAGETTAWVFKDFMQTSPYVARRIPQTSDFPALPRPATVATSRTTSSNKATANTQSQAANIPASGDVAGFAAKFVGSKYVWGGASPSGFDCSGLTMYVYSKHGVRLPHSAAGQYSERYGTRISYGNLAPGDLVFFAGTNGGRGISHVAVYIGGGRIVHAMTPKQGVQVSNLGDSYWQKHYYGALRPAR